MSYLEGKTILVTGAAGFVGSHLAERLARISGVKLLLLSRVERQSTENKLVWLKNKLERLTPEYWSSLDIGQIDYVFHLGGFIPRISADGNRIDQIVDDNILGTRALLHGLPGKPAKLIFSSTVDVYAQPKNGEVLTESSKVSPATLYGASKLFCESLVSEWAKQKDVGYSILRYGHIYGPGEERFAKLIPRVIRSLLADQAPVVHGHGSAVRDFLYVGDVVEATVRAASAEGSIGPINIVSGESVSVKEIVQLLIRSAGGRTDMRFSPEMPEGSSLRFDGEMMRTLLGDWPMTNLEKGLASEIESFRRNAP
jgi:nucleoside-diphosphate-sugar epimerase